MDSRTKLYFPRNETSLLFSSMAQRCCHLCSRQYQVLKGRLLKREQVCNEYWHQAFIGFVPKKGKTNDSGIQREGGLNNIHRNRRNDI